MVGVILPVVPVHRKTPNLLPFGVNIARRSSVVSLSEKSLGNVPMIVVALFSLMLVVRIVVWNIIIHRTKMFGTVAFMTFISVNVVARKPRLDDNP